MNQPNEFPHDFQDASPAVRARVPEHASVGVFSTGMIIMTGATEFILDFVQNLGRPHQIVARVIVPHLVLPQFADALATNIELYKNRFGPLPTPRIPGQQEGLRSEVVTHGMPYADPHAEPMAEPMAPPDPAPEPPPLEDRHLQANRSSQETHGGIVTPPSTPIGHSPTSSGAGQGPSSGESHPPTSQSSPAPITPPPRRPTAQEVYDDLKLRDDLLNGKYANAVMIGHGPNEFSFDFITNFYPQSAVSCRVFVGAGQALRILDSLRTAWDQLKPRYFPPPS